MAFNRGTCRLNLLPTRPFGLVIGPEPANDGTNTHSLPWHMNPLSRWAPSSAWFAGLLLLANNALNAATDPTPDVAAIQINAGRPVLRFNPVPAAVSYSIYGGSDLTQPFSLIPGSLLDFQWTGNNPAAEAVGFYRVQAQTMSPAALTAANLLQRIAYGPTPDDLDEINRIGVEAYIEKQLTPESIVEDLDTPQPFVEEWRKVTITGVVTSSTLYIYLDGPGDVYLDGLRLVAGSTDNGTAPNLIRNGDFDTALGNEWAFAANVNTSARSAQVAKTGNASLHLIATEGGSSLSSSLSQVVTPSLVTTATSPLSYSHSTANTNSANPSPSRSVNTAPLTMPLFDSTLAAATSSTHVPPSLR